MKHSNTQQEAQGSDRDIFDRPPLVTRGANLPEGEVGIDWVTVTMPREHLEEVTQRLEECIGPCTIGKGFNGYGSGRHFAYAAAIAYSDEDRPELCVKLPGDTCGRLGSLGVLELLAWVYGQGGKATRIDVRSDFKGESLDLIDLVRESCERRQLCRCRRWKTEEPRGNDGAYLGRGVTLGRRGKDGSGRYVRVYDKGLETGEALARTWERWETEFCKDAADQVARVLIEADDWKRDALAVALGAVEFREWTGSASLVRRPLAAWWSAFLGGVRPVLVKAKRTPTTLKGFVGWVGRCVLPTLTTMAHESGQSVQSVLDHFKPDKPLPRSKSPVVWEYLDALVDMLDGNPSLTCRTPGREAAGVSACQPPSVRFLTQW